MPSPLIKWVGGKGGMLKHLKPLLPEKWNVWHEPFVGAGGMLYGCSPAKARISDINWMLVNLHVQTRDSPSGLWRKALELGGWDGCDLETFLERRAEFNRMLREGEKTLKSAAMMLWVSRHAFNGLYRVNGRGEFNAPWNRNMARALLRSERDFLECSSVLQNAEILNVDFEEMLEPVRAGDFVFLDPPYVPDAVSGDFVSYDKGGFSREDHIRTAETARRLAERGAFVLATNNDSPWTRELYDGFHFHEYGTNSGIRAGRKRREVAMTSYRTKALDGIGRFC